MVMRIKFKQDGSSTSDSLGGKPPKPPVLVHTLLGKMCATIVPNTIGLQPPVNQDNTAACVECRSIKSFDLSLVICYLPQFILYAGLFLSVFVSARQADAEDVRVLPAGQVPSDARLGPLKTLNGTFPFQVPDSTEQWEQRRDSLRRRILVAAGLWPMPTKTPLDAVIHGRVERDGFSVERVYFQSLPGHYVTGLLFRPTGGAAPFPAVLCPHGHSGRLQDHGATKIRELIVEGRERFEASGRFPKLARCAQLARMGCVAFVHDMLGYADSQQIPSEVAHRFSELRPHLENPERWGFNTAQAELRMQNILGLQLLNSMRGLDFLASLSDVDPDRLVVTGSSGGGTQTLLLCAVDPRPVASFPQGMVSTSMQGGCVCENACLLRIGTGNVELAALCAPRPMAMTAADDWTREMMTSGYPELVKLYEMLGVKDHVFCKPLVHFPHNYNYVTRALMYRWFNEHLGLGLEEPIVEEDYELLSAEEQSVWNSDHPAPEDGGERHEVAVTQWLAGESQRRLGDVYPIDLEATARFREFVGGAFETIIGRTLPPKGAVTRRKIGKHDWSEFLEMKDLVRFEDQAEELPVVWLYPSKVTWNGELVVWVDGAGKQALYEATGVPRAEVRELLAEGYAVVGLDLFMQGEFLVDGGELSETRLVESSRPTAAYTFGYNHTVFARRVHDLMSLVAFARDDEHSPRIHVVGINGAGPVVALASAQMGDAIERRVLDTEGFRFVGIKSIRDTNFLPGAVKYGDVPAILALSAPHPMWIAGEGESLPEIVQAAYQAASATSDLQSVPGGSSEVVRAAFGLLGS